MVVTIEGKVRPGVTFAWAVTIEGKVRPGVTFAWLLQ